MSGVVSLSVRIDKTWFTVLTPGVTEAFSVAMSSSVEWGLHTPPSQRGCEEEMSEST